MPRYLRLKLLGNAEVWQDERLVTGFRSTKAQALLYYLAVTAKPHIRPALAGLLWADIPESRARNNLSRTLTNLRRLVGPHLSITRSTIAFQQDDACWLDVAEFQAGAKDLTAIDRLQTAIDLYQGDFLDGFYVSQAPLFEAWVLGERTHLRELALQALHRLSDYYIAQGQSDRPAALAYTQRLLALEPWWEEAHRQLMRLLAEEGQRSAALVQYETCRRVLAAELGVEPAPETVALYDQIRSGTLNQTTSTALAAPDLPAFPADKDLPAFEAPLVVAREPELTRLHEVLDLALQGQGQLMFVTGEAGRGKTTVIQEFARQAQKKAPELLVVGGNGQAISGVGDPYLLFREILSMLTGDIQAGTTAGPLSRDHAHRLWQQTPVTIQVLLEWGADLIGTLISLAWVTRRAKVFASNGTAWEAQWEQLAAQRAARRPFADFDQTNLFQQYIAVLQVLAQNRPLLLILDDLQWADAGSIDLLFHLGRQLTANRLMVVGAYRPADVGAGRGGERHPLDPVLNELQRRFGGQQVDLHQADNRRLVEAILDSEPNRLSPTFREGLYSHTQGHALFTVEILRMIQARGDLIKDDEGYWVEGPDVEWSRLPAKVEGVIAERLERLPAELQEILQVASIMGEDFTAEVVAQVLQAEVGPVIRQLSGPLTRQHRLVYSQSNQRVNGQRLSHYRFRHNLFQNYLYHRLDEAERAYWHEAVAQVLEQLYAGQTQQVAVQLAWHFEAAGLMRQAVDYLQQAGEYALAISAYPEARTHIEKALELLDGMAEAESASLSASLRHQLGQALFYLSDFPAAQAVLEMGLAEARRQNDLYLVSDILNALGRAVRELGNYEQSQLYLEESMALAHRIEDEALLARVLQGLGTLQWQLGHYDQAKRYCEESLVLSEEIGDTIQQLFSLHSLCSIAYAQQDIDQIEQLATQGLSQARQIGYRQKEAGFLTELALVAWQRGQYDSAEAVYQQALPILRRVGQRTMVAWVLTSLGEIAVRQADYAAARRYLHEALGMHQFIGINISLSAVFVYGWLLAKEEKIEQGLALLGLCLYHPALREVFKWEIYNLYLPDLDLDPQDPAVVAHLEAGKKLDLDQVIEESLAALSEEV